MRQMPTAPVAAGSLIVGYAVAASTGSRPLGGVVLAAGGVWCIQAWTRRHGARTAATLTGVGLGAFAASHVLALAIGAWPSVLLVSAGAAAVVWMRADSRTYSRAVSRPAAEPAPGLAFRSPTR
jgi:hypothetical protein